MYKSQFINSLLLIGGVSTFPGATFAQQNSQVHQKNVLLILVDDLKPNLGSCFRQWDTL